MFAVRLHEFGPAENLTYEEIPDPVPGEGQVRIAVEAAGVHLIDTVLRAGKADGLPMPLPDLPMTPGREVAGAVDDVGPGVEKGWVGRRVVAHLGPAGSGGYAERAVASVEALHEIRGSISAEHAVAMIGTGRTAMAILEAAALSDRDVVLITAAAGGLGSLFVQAARHAGALVVGVAGGPNKVAQVRRLGADIAIDYLEDGWPDRVRTGVGDRPITVVHDGVGGSAGRAAFDLLGSGGRMVIFGWSAGEPTALTTGDIIGRGLTVTSDIGPRIFRRPGGIRDLENRALEELVAGRLTPLVQRFPIERAAEAHAALERRTTVGKVVLVPSAGSI